MLQGVPLGVAALFAAACTSAPSERRTTATVAPDAIRIPGEHEPQTATIMAWPHERQIWGRMLEDVQGTIAAIARAIAAFQPVIMVTSPVATGDVRSALGSDVRVLELAVNDCWTRDTGPIVGRTSSGLVGLDFVFNGWGGKFPPWDDDDALPAGVCADLEMERRPVAMVLEGGAILMDGEGTLITTEQCLLNPNRNPDMTKAQIERRLKSALGVDVVIWLPHGLWMDTITNGHVDGVAGYIEPGRLMIQTTANGTPDDTRLAENRQVLRDTPDARGRTLDLVEMPYYPPLTVAGFETVHSYINFAAVNGAVIVPTMGAKHDGPALDVIREAFPDREVVGVPARALDWGGGGVHCVTQQVPAR